LSVCSSRHSAAAGACGSLLLRAVWAENVDQQQQVLSGNSAAAQCSAANAASAMLTAELTRLKTDLFVYVFVCIMQYFHFYYIV